MPNQDILLVLKVVPHNNRNARHFQNLSNMKALATWYFVVGIFDSVF